MEPVCPRCGAPVALGQVNHETACLERQLSMLSRTGVERGVSGEAPGVEDDRAADLIGGLIGFLQEVTARERAAQAALARPALPATRLRAGEEDLDTMVARLLDWRCVGWANGALVSGESAWHDPMVMRRRFSTRDEDAAEVREHPMPKSLELIRIHRIHNNRWEWHMARRDRFGTMETLVTAPTAPLAICRAALRVGSLAKARGQVG